MFFFLSLRAGILCLIHLCSVCDLEQLNTNNNSSWDTDSTVGWSVIPSIDKEAQWLSSHPPRSQVHSEPPLPPVTEFRRGREFNHQRKWALPHPNHLQEPQLLEDYFRLMRTMFSTETQDPLMSCEVILVNSNTLTLKIAWKRLE